MKITVKDNGELDALIAEKIMGWKIVNVSWRLAWIERGSDISDFKSFCYKDEFIPSCSVHFAYQVLGKLMGDGWLVDMHGTRNEWDVGLCHVTKGRGRAVNKDAPVAICIAALLALGIEVEFASRAASTTARR